MLAIILLLAFSGGSASSAQTTASLPPLTAPQLAAYERGQSYERVVLGGQDPKSFAIELLHPVFLADLDAFASGKDFPADKGTLASIVNPLRAFLDSGDPSSIPSSLGGSSFFDPYLDKKPPDPATWWFVEAGMADVDARANGANVVGDLLAFAHPKWMNDHASLGGAYATALGAMPQSLDGVSQYDAAIENVFEPAAPSVPIVHVAYPVGLMGYARLGLTFQTVAQMLDSPPLLAQHQSQRFVDEVASEIEEASPEAISKDLLGSWRASLDVGSDFDRDKAFGINTQVSDKLVTSLSKPDQSAFFVGMLATQSIYNAIVFRDPSTATEQLGALAQFTALDAEDPAIHDLRVRLASTSTTDWAGQVKAGRALVDEIETHP